jgi:phenylalanyl-tRNA synthetase beta chain
MNASYQWLRDFVRFDLGPEQVRDLLTSRAATVEELIRLRADLSEIVVGRVVEAAPHPDSDHLWVTKVDAGQPELVNVVCGAANVTVGTLYPFAPVGSTLPGGLRLEKRRIRGAISEGMLCSPRELGLGIDHQGIMALDIDVAPGTRFLDAVPVGDTRLVVDVLPNRPDLLSHEGLAREISAAILSPLMVPEIPGAVLSNGKAGKGPPVDVAVEDTDGCPRYMAAVIRGVKIAPSPPWLAARIEAVGARSINNVVDATNYMLHGFGQPTHAFDLARLNGGMVVVRRARAGEKIRTLDGVDRALDNGMTVIADAERAQAIAGVIGGEGSEVTDATTDILLEVAAFDTRRVRATRRKLGVSTDASYRFERGVDIEALPRHLDFAVDLIVAVAGGTLSGKPADVRGDIEPLPAIAVRTSRVQRLLGEPIEAAESESLLSAVGFSVARDDQNQVIHVTPPSWRTDVVGEPEVIEEIARLHGYDMFSAEIRPFRPGNVPESPLHARIARVRSCCVGAGLFEARPLPFTRHSDDRSVRVRNPLAEDEAFLRQSVVDTLARRAEYNLSRMQRDVRLFELGAVFARGEPVAGALPDERMHAAVLVMGHRRPPHFTEPKPPLYDEWDAKGLAEAIGEAAFPGHPISCVPAESGALWSVVAGDVGIGVVTSLTLDGPAWAAPAFGVEINLDALDASAAVSLPPLNGTVAAGHAALPVYSAIPALPAIEIDLALVVPDSVRAAEVERVINKSAGELLEKLVLFDEFRGGEIPAGSRSLAWALTFRHPERTLRDKEIQGRTAKILKTLEAELGVKQRTA